MKVNDKSLDSDGTLTVSFLSPKASNEVNKDVLAMYNDPQNVKEFQIKPIGPKMRNTSLWLRPLFESMK